MNKETLLLSSVILFIIIYFAVRLAIRPLLYKQDETATDSQDVGLIKLRDIEVLSPNELEEVIKIYQEKGVKIKAFEQYQKYEKVLNELKEIGYFSYGDYVSRTDKLKKYFKID